MPRRGNLVGDAYIRIWADTGPMKRALDREMASLGDEEADNYLTHFGDRIDEHADAEMRRAHDSLARALATGDFDAMWKKSGMSVREFSNTVRVKLGEIEKEAKAGRITWDHYNESLITLDRWQARAANSTKRLAKDVGDGARMFRDGETRLGRFTNMIRNGTNRLDLFANASGRAFGKGSRNNFLNFTGTVVKGLASILVLPFKALGSVIDGVHDLVANFSDLRAGGASVGKALVSTLAPALESVGVALVAAVAGVVAFSLGLPLLISLFVELAGAIVAVAGALGVGLLGALLPVGPVIAALVAGILPLLIFMRDVKKEVPGAVAVMKSFTINVDRLSKKVHSAVMVVATQTAALFAQITKAIGPFISAMALAGGEVIASLRRALRDPDTKKFLRTFQTDLPKIFRALGFAANEFAVGLIAFFKPILPFAVKLADGFNSLATKFRIWAESPKGQHQIQDFMNTAWDLANKLVSILGTLFQILGKVLFSGAKGPGRDFLTWLDTTLTKFNEWLDTPAGKTAMETFWDRVTVFMRDAKTIVENVLIAIAKLTSPETQKELNDIATAIATVSGWLDTLAGAIMWVNTQVKLQVDAFSQAWAAITGWISSIKDTISGGGWLGAASAAVAGLYGVLIKPFADAAFTIVTKIHDIFVTIINAGWVGAAAAAVAGIVATIGAPFVTAYQTVSSWIATTAQRIRNGGFLSAAITVGIGVAATLAAPFINAWRTITGWISNIRTAISGGNFAATAARAVSGIAGILVAPFVAAWQQISGWISAIGRLIDGLISKARNLPIIGNLVPGAASGGVFTGPTVRKIGEAGAEAVVPLDRPLSMVDPSVRWLSAIAQGKQSPMAAGGIVTPGKSIVISPGAIQVYTIAQNPENVARAMLDRLVTAIA